MIISLSGDNSYQISLELHKLKNKLGKDNVLGSVQLEGQEATIEDVKNELSSYSLFSSERLVILYQPSKIKGFDEFIKQAESYISENTTAVIVEPLLDKRKSYYKYLQKNTDFKQFNKLNTPELIKWVAEFTKQNGGQITHQAATHLVERLGDDQMLLSQEINKLILYSNEIDIKSIDTLTELSPSSTVFELLDAAFSLNPGKALTLYNEQRLQKVEPEQILAMLSWQLNTIAVYIASKNLSSTEVAAKSGLSPYTISKARQISAKLSTNKVKTLVNDLCNLDYSSKTKSFDLDEGLKNFIVGLSF